MREAFENEWIDFYPRKGKEGGAFCAGAMWLKQSRILTNYDGYFGSVDTLAHELGHAFHNRQIENHAPLNQDYPMPVAETASTFNEVHLGKAARAEASGEELLNLLENDIKEQTQCIVDIYSRYLFETAVFEQSQNKFLMADDLKQIMLDAQKKTYGDGLDPECMHPYMWVCKGHYYSEGLSFYNFPYAFGNLFALGLYSQFEKEGEAFIGKYKAMLSATPCCTIEEAGAMMGIDLTKNFLRLRKRLSSSARCRRRCVMEDLKQIMPKKLGFGCMRLPVANGNSEEIDDAVFCRMIDRYMEQGFVYFDTAYPYHNQKSEEAVRRCLVERYDRERFLLADKMPVWLVQNMEDYSEIFERQLARCGVTYFDFYLFHAMNKTRVEETEKTGGFAFVQRMKTEGRIRHIGFSFHDTAEALEEILKNHPEMEFVQLQINYYDWESENVQSRKCYEVAQKYGVPVIVMEPVKGGTLANMTGRPAEILKELSPEASFASYAIRYAASLENVMLVLSGMSDEQQLIDNTAYMREFRPLDERERAAIARVVEELAAMPTIACTKCRYCVEGCPKKIPIPDVFEDYNMTVQFGINETNRGSYRRHTADGGSANVCIRCGKCEGQCPQHLPIRDLLVKVAETFAE